MRQSCPHLAKLFYQVWPNYLWPTPTLDKLSLANTNFGQTKFQISFLKVGGRGEGGREEGRFGGKWSSGWGPEPIKKGRQRVGPRRVGGPKVGGPKGWGPEIVGARKVGGPKGLGARRADTRRVEDPKFRAFFPLSRHNFLSFFTGVSHDSPRTPNVHI